MNLMTMMESFVIDSLGYILPQTNDLRKCSIISNSSLKRCRMFEFSVVYMNGQHHIITPLNKEIVGIFNEVFPRNRRLS